MSYEARSLAADRGVYVWEGPVRVTHWLNVLAIVTLSVTGYYIGNPVDGVSGMTWARAIHRVSAYVFTASLLARFYWAFAGNRWASWRVFAPYLTGEGRRGMKETLRFYLFLRREPPGDVGHNALAGATYSLAYLLMVVEALTGFALLSVDKGGWWRTAFGWVFLFGSPQGVRLVHHLGMWLLLGFAVHHVYSAVLMDLEERNGLMGSIFSGFKFPGPGRRS